jgi:predicted unusual protein kinase regulating ubiquinone biosynthesis (AarF/ABC1/UbiB family)
MRVAESTQRLSQAPVTEPIAPPWRIFKAYTVTVIVLCSYLWIRLQARYRADAVILRKLDRAHLRNARRIYRAIVELQGLYIKVGQLFSIMTNFLPDAFRGELETLQDQVPARDYSAIDQRFREEFDGKGPADLFDRFEERPIASASIAQVHRAWLRGGIPVAVKVQYPGIERLVRSDLIALRHIINLVQRFVATSGLEAIYREIRDIVLAELDFTQEAENAERISRNFENNPNVKFPRASRELTTPRILTLEYVDGVKSNDILGLARLEIDRTTLAKLVIETYCQQIFRDGIYHADPHPGNILVSRGTVIHFVDFGAVAEVSETMRHGLLLLLEGAIRGDTQKIIGALKEMGFMAHSADPRVYDRVVEYFHERFKQEIKLESLNLKDIRFDADKGLENLADLRKMDISLADLTDAFHVPKEWIMLERTILLIMGLCTELDPNLNPMDVLRPHVEEFVLGKDRDWSTFVVDSLRDTALSVLSLPAEIRKFTHRAMQGEIEVKLAGYQNNGPLYYALGQQIVFSGLGITALVAALTLFDRGMLGAAKGCVAAAATCGLLVLRSMWIGRRLLQRKKWNRNNGS